MEGRTQKVNGCGFEFVSEYFARHPGELTRYVRSGLFKSSLPHRRRYLILGRHINQLALLVGLQPLFRGRGRFLRETTFYDLKDVDNIGEMLWRAKDYENLKAPHSHVAAVPRE